MMYPEPDLTAWLAEAKQSKQAPNIGMYLTHNGVVRATPRHIARNEEAPQGVPEDTNLAVSAIEFSYDKDGLHKIVNEALTWEGVYYVRVWLNEGVLNVGDSLMYVLIGADIRPNAINALTKLVSHIKNHLVVERELYA